jgi:hypothetical protein
MERINGGANLFPATRMASSSFEVGITQIKLDNGS